MRNLIAKSVVVGIVEQSLYYNEQHEQQQNNNENCLTTKTEIEHNTVVAEEVVGEVLFVVNQSIIIVSGRSYRRGNRIC